MLQILKNGVRTAELDEPKLAALVARYVTRGISRDEESALFEVLYAAGVKTDWMVDASHFQFWPLGLPRPQFVFTEAYGLPKM
tara:strand:- start:29 stop:277 length:249 start_codon:yes stop_codon:yes gene_type:complete